MTETGSEITNPETEVDEDDELSDLAIQSRHSVLHMDFRYSI